LQPETGGEVTRIPLRDRQGEAGPLDIALALVIFVSKGIGHLAFLSNTQTMMQAMIRALALMVCIHYNIVQRAKETMLVYAAQNSYLLHCITLTALTYPFCVNGSSFSSKLMRSGSDALVMK
jgi:hypothetical protein